MGDLKRFGHRLPSLRWHLLNPRIVDVVPFEDALNESE